MSILHTCEFSKTHSIKYGAHLVKVQHWTVAQFSIHYSVKCDIQEQMHTVYKCTYDALQTLIFVVSYIQTVK